MLEWMIMPLKRYFDFSGRSRRKEYWSFALLLFIIYLVPLALMLAGGFPLMSMNDPEAMPAAPGPLFLVGAGLMGLVALAIIIPTIAVTVRRLHDRDLSGWWYLGVIAASMIPFVGFLASIAFLVLMFLPGTPGPNRFGPDPKDPANLQAFA